VTNASAYRPLLALA